MALDTSLVGKKLKPYSTIVAPRATMSYAAGTGDANPRYLDDRREDVVAPPMYAVALSWPVIGNLKRYADFEVPAEAAMGVHFSEQLRFERLLRPGERVTVQGDVAAIGSHRAGAYVVFELLVHDEQGKLVHTEHFGVLLRGATLDGPSAGLESLPVLGSTDASEPVWERALATSPLAAHMYDACTGIELGIHTSPRLAEAVGLPGIILQGTATLAMAVRELVDDEAGGDPERVRGIACRFGAFVRPGEEIRLRLLERRPAGDATELRFVVLNEQRGEAVRDGALLLAR